MPFFSKRRDPGPPLAPGRIRPGTEVVIESAEADASPFRVVFEDDGETGFVYGLDMRRPEAPIVDALHVYNAKQVTPAELDSELAVIWSEQGHNAAVLINGHAHAVVGFEPALAMCANDFPPPRDYVDSHAWDEPRFRALFPRVPSEWSTRQPT